MKYSEQEYINMMENVVNELDLSDEMIHRHGQERTEPAELVRLILDEKDHRISLLEIRLKTKKN